MGVSKHQAAQIQTPNSRALIFPNTHKKRNPNLRKQPHIYNKVLVARGATSEMGSFGAPTRSETGTCDTCVRI